MDTQESVRKQFGKSAAAYLTSAVHAQGDDLQQLVALGQLAPTDLVLDVGTAVGHTALAFAPHVRRVVGLDLTPEMLGEARNHAERKGVTNLDLVEANVSSLPFPDASFDVVTCRIVAHHFPQLHPAIAEIGRVLKPGGLFLLVDNYAPEQPELDRFVNTLEQLRDPSHVRAHRLSEWQAVLERSGLESEVARTWHSRHPFADWVKRSQTPPDVVARLRAMLDDAAAAARETFKITDDPELTFHLLKAIVVARK